MPSVAHRLIVGPPECKDSKIRALLSTSTLGELEVLHVLKEPLPFAPPPEPFLIAGLLPAMTLGGVLENPEPISPKLLESLPRIQEIFLTWDRHLWGIKHPTGPRLEKVRVNAPKAPREAVEVGSQTASFFTAGVDSFYTVLKHLDEIDALIYVRGFDVKLSQAATRRTVMRGIRRAAEGLGKPLIELRSNLRDFALNFISWGPYHGAALASAAALFAGRFRRIYIPSTTTYDNLVPLGSHPLLDPLWSTDAVQIVHDGCEASRIEKLNLIADNSEARSWLRVCFENPDGAYNCSSCEKCLRTMIQLRLLGHLDEFSSFPLLDVREMSFAFEPKASSWALAWGNTLRILETLERDPELQEGIKRVLERESRRPKVG